MKKFEIERTKKGLPAMWERGGGSTNTGFSWVIAAPDGVAKKPIYIRRGGHLANGLHALIVIHIGDYIIKTYHHRKDFEIEVFKIVQIEEEAFAELKYEFSRGEWNEPLPEKLENAVKAAREKALCYHCREPHYIYKEEN